MVIALIVAMGKEINQYLEDSNASQVLGIPNYYRSEHNEIVVYTSISSIGKVNAAMTTTSILENNPVDLIINVGFAGSILDKGILVIDRVVQFDIDTTAMGDMPGNIPGINQVFLEMNTEYTNKIKEILKNKKYDYLVASQGTSDAFIEEDKALIINQLFDVYSFDMELGAIAQVAYHYDTPLVSIKIVSDKVSGEQYDTNTNDFSLSKLISKILLDIFNNL